MDEGETFLQATLDSGVDVVAQPMAGVESAAIGILIGTGARDEDPGQPGVTHFTEQTLFRGTEHLDARALSERFDALGIGYDSSSGIEMTLLSAILIGSRLPEAIELLADVVRYPAFPPDDVESVRALILQEIQQREDRPAQRVMDMLRQSLFAGNPLGHDVLGSADSVTSTNRDDLVAYWASRFTANNMTISVAGNFDWPETLEQLSRITDGWPRGAGRSQVAPPDARGGITVIERDSSQENLGFAFRGVSASDDRYFTAGLLAQAFGGGSNSRIYREVREKRGLAYAAQARFDGFEQTGLFRVYVGTSAERAHESVAVVLDELHKLEADGITEDELRLSKTRLKSQVIMRSESTLARMGSNLRSWWFERELHALSEIRARIDAVTADDVRALAQSLQISSTLAAVAIGPRPEEELFGGVAALA